jgi:Spy/CpxP family protein refolding chaperone
MKRLHFAALAAAAAALSAVAVWAQPPDGGEPKGPGKKGPPPFEPGRVLPPFIRDGLDLTEEQQRRLGDLERDVKQRLLEILTPEQKTKLEELRRRRPPGKGGDGGGPPKKKGPGGPLEQPRADSSPAPAGIQWFATWEGGLAEAQGTGRPILLVSAAPHCAGVSGVW